MQAASGKCKESYKPNQLQQHSSQHIQPNGKGTRNCNNGKAGNTAHCLSTVTQELPRDPQTIWQPKLCHSSSPSPKQIHRQPKQETQANQPLQHTKWIHESTANRPGHHNRKIASPLNYNLTPKSYYSLYQEDKLFGANADAFSCKWHGASAEAHSRDLQKHTLNMNLRNWRMHSDGLSPVNRP